jgi:hypothetical protein
MMWALNGMGKMGQQGQEEEMGGLCRVSRKYLKVNRARGYLLLFTHVGDRRLLSLAAPPEKAEGGHFADLEDNTQISATGCK